MEKRKKILIFTAIIAALLILAVVIALLCFGKSGGEAAPEATELTTSTEPATQGSTAPPTQGATSPTDSTDSSTPTDPTETADPSAPTDPTQITEPSAPVSQPTAPPTQPATQSTKPATKAPSQPGTPTYRPTNPATQPPTSSNITQLSITTEEYSGVPLGGTLQLEYTYTGSRPLTWSSDDPNVLTVNQKGVVKGISEGMAKITVSDGKTRQPFCFTSTPLLSIPHPAWFFPLSKNCSSTTKFWQTPAYSAGLPATDLFLLLTTTAL